MEVDQSPVVPLPTVQKQENGTVDGIAVTTMTISSTVETSSSVAPVENGIGLKFEPPPAEEPVASGSMPYLDQRGCKKLTFFE